MYIIYYVYNNLVYLISVYNNFCCKNIIFPLFTGIMFKVTTRDAVPDLCATTAWGWEPVIPRF